MSPSYDVPTPDIAPFINDQKLPTKNITFPSGPVTSVTCVYEYQTTVLDNVYAVQFYDQQGTQPVHDFLAYDPIFYASAKRAVTGVIAFNLHFQDIFETLVSYGRCEKLSDDIYRFDELIITHETSTANYFDSKISMKQSTKLKDVFISKPGFSLIPDQTPIQLISQFIQMSISKKDKIAGESDVNST